jgi:hypothetical protein
MTNDRDETKKSDAKKKKKKKKRKLFRASATCR